MTEPDLKYELNPPVHQRAALLILVADAVIDGTLERDQAGLMAVTACGAPKTRDFMDMCRSFFGCPKDHEDRRNRALKIVEKYSHQARIEQLDLVKEQFWYSRKRLTMHDVGTVLDICRAEHNPYCQHRAALFLSPLSKQSSVEFFRAIAPGAISGITI